MARWVVFGGTGYIGSALCMQLVAQGESVISVSRAKSGPDGCDHRTLDLGEVADFDTFLRPGDHVVYAAGLASRKACERSPELAKRLNGECPLAVLRVAEAAAAGSFTYLSSVKALTPPAGVIACESTGQPATDAYGHSKWCAEQHLLSTRGTCRVNVIRPAVVYGDARCGVQAGNSAGKVHSLLRLLGRSLTVLPSSGRRTMVHIDDLVAAILAVAGNSLCDRQVYIAAEPHFYDVGSIASALSGRQIRTSRRLTRWLLSPLRPLASLPAARRLLEVERCELYSAARLRAALHWRAHARYSDYLRGGV